MNILFNYQLQGKRRNAPGPPYRILLIYIASPNLVLLRVPRHRRGVRPHACFSVDVAYEPIKHNPSFPSESNSVCSYLARNSRLINGRVLLFVFDFASIAVRTSSLAFRLTLALIAERFSEPVHVKLPQVNVLYRYASSQIRHMHVWRVKPII